MVCVASVMCCPPSASAMSVNIETAWLAAAIEELIAPTTSFAETSPCAAKSFHRSLRVLRCSSCSSVASLSPISFSSASISDFKESISGFNSAARSFASSIAFAICKKGLPSRCCLRKFFKALFRFLICFGSRFFAFFLYSSIRRISPPRALSVRVDKSPVAINHSGVFWNSSKLAFAKPCCSLLLIDVTRFILVLSSPAILFTTSCSCWINFCFSCGSVAARIWVCNFNAVDLSSSLPNCYAKETRSLTASF